MPPVDDPGQTPTPGELPSPAADDNRAVVLAAGLCGCVIAAVAWSGPILRFLEQIG